MQVLYGALLAPRIEPLPKESSKYLPQYGAYCAWAVANGYTASVSPYAWKIVDGKLYLNYNQSIQKRWEEDIPGNIAKADENWPKLSDK